MNVRNEWKKKKLERLFKDIDTKSIGIITITGILITFISRDFINSECITLINCLKISLFASTLLTFLVTILFSVLALQVKGYEGLSTKLLKEDLKNEPPVNQIRGIINTISKTEDSMSKINNEKAENLKHAIITLGISISLLILHALSSLF